MSMPVREEAGPLRIGDTFLGKYEIQGLIGRGGYACVYRAHHSWGRRDFAIKVLHKASGLTSEMRYRGQTEAQVLMNELKHPNIVEVTDAGVEQGTLYIIMELLRGRTFRDVLNEHGRLSITETLELFAQIADTMHFAHGKGIIHRDLKPENIFVIPGNVPKVLDFGIAKIMGPDAWQTQRNLVLGTMLYISPEQVLGRSASPRSDIYAIGLMLFEALLGKHICRLENKVMTPHILAGIQVHYQPKRLDELDGRIPGHVADLVHRAITKRPEQRFSTAQEFAEEIRTCLERYHSVLASRHEKLVWRELSEPAPPAVDPAPPAVDPAPPAVEPAPPRVVVPAPGPEHDAATVEVPSPSFVPMGRKTLRGVGHAALGGKGLIHTLPPPRADDGATAEPSVRVMEQRQTPSTPSPFARPLEASGEGRSKFIRPQLGVVLAGLLVGGALSWAMVVVLLKDSVDAAEGEPRIVVESVSHEAPRAPRAAADDTAAGDGEVARSAATAAASASAPDAAPAQAPQPARRLQAPQPARTAQPTQPAQPPRALQAAQPPWVSQGSASVSKKTEANPVGSVVAPPVKRPAAAKGSLPEKIEVIDPWADADAHSGQPTKAPAAGTGKTKPKGQVPAPPEVGSGL